MASWRLSEVSCTGTVGAHGLDTPPRKKSWVNQRSSFELRLRWHAAKRPMVQLISYECTVARGSPCSCRQRMVSRPADVKFGHVTCKEEKRSL